MEVIASYYTDVGNVKKINQDSLSMKVVNSPHGKIVFAIVCDGMGGLEQGELASKEVVVAFNNWFAGDFARMVAGDNVTGEMVFRQWQELIEMVNRQIEEFADRSAMMMGTTVSVLLIYREHYYIGHVGDSRIYTIRDSVKQLTEDHTLVAYEVAQGILTQEQAMMDPRRSILLQCVGASSEILPQFDCGNLQGETTFLLCSDGFVHLVSEQELYKNFSPETIGNKEQLTQICSKMTKLVMERGERDNITVLAIVIR